MMDVKPELCAKIVGRVRKPDDDTIFIQIEDQFWDATLNMEKFSHIIVLWWITEKDRTLDRMNLTGTPPKENAELSGVFATRSPRRPTPIGVSIVAIKRIVPESKKIIIDQIDAFDNTPIVDIKPYMPSSDRVDNAEVPSWFKDNKPRYTTY
ncbi:MAG: tRNA (N6-threonylcarbamoyladenosine(37)-N6)-methyltransferase TrmO [Candidatus Lokiarchaeota archaeon]|nr:tRNA (N6-threonylcarbamoyladenosine(37)-N6)-methyltransferase TrmO [Candidatus Lokiarchaeota archaeon]